MESELLDTAKEERDDSFEDLSSTYIKSDPEDRDTKDMEFSKHAMERVMDDGQALNGPVSLPTKFEPDLERVKEEINMEDSFRVPENTWNMESKGNSVKIENDDDDEETLMEPVFVPVNDDFERTSKEMKEEISEESECTEGSNNSINGWPDEECSSQITSLSGSLADEGVGRRTEENFSKHCFPSEHKCEMPFAVASYSIGDQPMDQEGAPWEYLSRRQEGEQGVKQSQHSNNRENGRGTGVEVTLSEKHMETSASLRSSSEESKEGSTNMYNSENVVESDVDNKEALEEPLSLPTISEPDLKSVKEETNMEEIFEEAENTEDIGCCEDATKRENDDEEELLEPVFVPVSIDFEGKLEEIKEVVSEETESTEETSNTISRGPHKLKYFQTSSSSGSLPGEAVEMNTEEQVSNCFSSELLRQISASFSTAAGYLPGRQEEEHIAGVGQRQCSNQREIERGTHSEGEMQTSASSRSSSEKSERKFWSTFVCSTCKSQFSSKYFLDKHVRVHTGENPYNCSKCEKSFSSKGNLSLYMHLHTGQKPYSCSQCGKSYYQHSSFTKHMGLHRGEKPYSCSQCKKSFSQKGSLITHVRLHTDERPYKCSQCDKSFRDSGNLTAHAVIEGHYK